MEDIRRVREVDYQRRDGGGVGAVAAKEGGAVVETEVDKAVGVRHGGEGGAVGDAGGVEAALVGGDEGCAVGPEIGGVGGRVDGENDVDVALRLDLRVQRDVLQILASVDEGQTARLRGRRGGVVETVKGVGGVVCNVVAVAVDALEDKGDKVLGYIGNVLIFDLDQELVEQRGGSAHDVACAVEAANARVGVIKDTAGEVGTQVLKGREAKGCGIPGAKLKRVEFVYRGVDRHNHIPRCSSISHQYGIWRVRIDEAVGLRNRGPRVIDPSIGGIDQLKRQCSAPVVRERGIVSGVLLVAHLVLNRFEIICTIKQLHRAPIRSFEYRVFKPPHRLAWIVHQLRNGAEVVDVYASGQPPAAAQSRKIYRGLQQSPQMTGRR